MVTFQSPPAREEGRAENTPAGSDAVLPYEPSRGPAASPLADRDHQRSVGPALGPSPAATRVSLRVSLRGGVGGSIPVDFLRQAAVGLLGE